MAVHPSAKNILGPNNLAFMHGPAHKVQIILLLLKPCGAGFCCPAGWHCFKGWHLFGANC